MADIPRRNYALAHLNEVQLITGINDWLSFLDRKDRLVHLMKLAQPAGSLPGNGLSWPERGAGVATLALG